MANVLFMGLTQQALLPVALPAELTVTMTDLGRLSRAADGSAVRHISRAAVRTLRLVWENLGAADAENILTAVSAQFCYVKYSDPLECGFRTAQFCATTRQAVVRRVESGEPMLKKLSVTLEER